MKYILSLFMIFIFSYAVSAAASNINASDYENFDSTWAGQKVIPQNEYEETVQALEKEKSKAEEKEQAKKLKKFKGNSLHKDLDAANEMLPDQSIQDLGEVEQVILFPVDIWVDGKILEKGYYRAIAEKNEGQVYINLYQSHALMAKIRANETDDDFGEQDIVFLKIIPYKENVYKLILGSVYTNAYAFIQYQEPESSFIPQ